MQHRNRTFNAISVVFDIKCDSSLLIIENYAKIDETISIF
jgi:hypothetical protein